MTWIYLDIDPVDGYKCVYDTDRIYWKGKFLKLVKSFQFASFRMALSGKKKLWTLQKVVEATEIYSKMSAYCITNFDQNIFSEFLSAQ